MRKLLTLLAIGPILALFISACGDAYIWQSIDSTVIIEPVGHRWLTLRPVERVDNSCEAYPIIYLGKKKNCDGELQFFWFRQNMDGTMIVIEDSVENERKLPESLSYAVVDTISNPISDTDLRKLYQDDQQFGTLADAYLSPNKKFTLSENLNCSYPDNKYWTKELSSKTTKLISFDSPNSRYIFAEIKSKEETSNSYLPLIFLLLMIMVPIINMKGWSNIFIERNNKLYFGRALLILTFLFLTAELLKASTLNTFIPILIVNFLVCFLLWYVYVALAKILKFMRVDRLAMPGKQNGDAHLVISYAICASTMFIFGTESSFSFIWIPLSLILLLNTLASLRIYFHNIADDIKSMFY